MDDFYVGNEWFKLLMDFVLCLWWIICDCDGLYDLVYENLNINWNMGYLEPWKWFLFSGLEKATKNKVVLFSTTFPWPWKISLCYFQRLRKSYRKRGTIFCGFFLPVENKKSLIFCGQGKTIEYKKSLIFGDFSLSFENKPPKIYCFHWHLAATENNITLFFDGHMHLKISYFWRECPYFRREINSILVVIDFFCYIWLFILLEI
jgi:hypothetical protein